ncbi:MAG TPA: outer membrane protein transport protein [Rhodanobacteraceae bacterium]|nr:outer membrane protein transport protein [Rhodanobacteraceae bacterium]
MIRRYGGSHLAPILATLPLAVFMALASREAGASAFQLKENDAQGLGRSYAGSTAAPGDPAVIANNPAAMSEFRGPLVQADVTAINFSTDFHGGGTDALGRPLSGGDGGNGGTTKPVPAIYAATPIGDRWRVGAAVTVPFGFETSYDHGWVGRYHAYKSQLQSLALTLSASYAVSDELSLGASLVAQRTHANLTQAIDLGAVLAANPLLPPGYFLPQGADGFGGLDGDDWGYGWQAGLLWKPDANNRIGFNYHSQIDHTIEGDASFYIPDTVAQVLTSGGSTAFQDSGGRADFDTPWFATLSWWHTLNERISFGVDLSYTHWSSFRDLRVHFDNPDQPDSLEVFDYDNSLFGSIGMDYRLDDAWTLRGGLAIDGTPTHESTRDPRIPDATRRWLSLGIGYKASEHTEFNLGYAHLFVNDSHIAATTVTGDTLIGHFESDGNLLAISGTYRF